MRRKADGGNLPFLRPQPPRLSELVDELRAIEQSGVFSNFGPVNTRLEAALTERLFDGTGGCVTVVNATIGLMLAVRDAVGPATQPVQRYALMPSFTFAAAAHAAEWAGLMPLFCDIDPETWLPSAEAEAELLRRYEGRIAVIMPCATFGNCPDLARYDSLSRRTGIPVVVDAASALGSRTADGKGIAAGSRLPVIFSMHATKAFATSEGGVLHCADPDMLARLRVMGNFGFGAPREATMPGLNAKLSEVGALLALARLDGFDAIVRHREALVQCYRNCLPGWTFQRLTGSRHAHQFVPVLLPEMRGTDRAKVVEALARQGISVAHYFSPHLAEHAYFRNRAAVGELAATERVAARILSLPMSDSMTPADVERVAAALDRALPAAA